MTGIDDVGQGYGELLCGGFHCLSAGLPFVGMAGT